MPYKAASGVQVRGGDDPFDIPIYTLCRRWVRNDPYNDETTLAVPKVLTTIFKCMLHHLNTLGLYIVLAAL